MNNYTKMIGRTAAYSWHGLTVYVTIKDVKQSYGRVRYLIEPVAGSGQVWIETGLMID